MDLDLNTTKKPVSTDPDQNPKHSVWLPLETNKQTNADVKSGGTNKIRGRLDWMWINKSGVY